MSESAKDAAFGVPAKNRPPGSPVSHLAPVPMFDPMMQSARDLVQCLGWFRREIDRADSLCTNIEQVTRELLESRIAEDAARRVEAMVGNLRANVTKVTGFCERLESLTADLHDGFDLEFEMPKMAWTGRKEGTAAT